MKQWLSILVVVCVLLTACSVEARGRPILPKTTEKVGDEEGARLKDNLRYVNFPNIKAFLDIKVIDKQSTGVGFEGSFGGDLDRNELTDYLKLKIKNNFANIYIEEPDIDKYTKEQIGIIRLRVWIHSDKYPAAIHLGWKFYNRASTKGVFFDTEFASSFYNVIPYPLWFGEMLGIARNSNDLSKSIKHFIDETIEELAILFFKVRGEL